MTHLALAVAAHEKQCHALRVLSAGGLEEDRLAVAALAALDALGARQRGVRGHVVQNHSPLSASSPHAPS